MDFKFILIVTILMIRTKSSGVLAQGGRTTLLTSKPSSLDPRLYPFVLTNMSGR